MSEKYVYHGYDKINAVFEQFAEVGKLAVLQELKVRLLANKVDEIKKTSYSHRVSETEEAVIDHFSSKKLLNEKEVLLIKQSRRIRNKVLHCDFDKAIRLIEKFTGEKVKSGVVHELKIDKLEGDELIDFLFEAKEQIKNGNVTNNRIKDVSETNYSEGGLFGWLLHTAGSGALAKAQEIFVSANLLIDRLTSDTSLSEIED